MRTVLAALALLGSAGGLLHASDVYRSVDAEGHVVYQDQPDPSSTTQSVLRLETAQGPPALIHLCWTNCFTLQWNQGVYTRLDGTEETWTIEQFTPHAFVLHRHDAPAAWNGHSTDVVYAGQVSDSRLVNVTVNGAAVPQIAAAWGPALDSLPGSNAERDRRDADQEPRAAVAPPPLPAYDQPPLPADGYLWTPGYWSWRNAGYIWVPGLWVLPPRVGVLWTPGYWSFTGSAYLFHAGYWGPRIGYYGGVDYGFGYSGSGFAGGRWVGGAFAYNTAVANVQAGLARHTYRESVAVNAGVSRVSYDGGPGGTSARPNAPARGAASGAPMVARSAPHPSTPTPATPARSAHLKR
jgi:hypothetical protein